MFNLDQSLVKVIWWNPIVKKIWSFSTRCQISITKQYSLVTYLSLTCLEKLTFCETENPTNSRDHLFWKLLCLNYKVSTLSETHSKFKMHSSSIVLRSILLHYLRTQAPFPRASWPLNSPGTNTTHSASLRFHWSFQYLYQVHRTWTHTIIYRIRFLTKTWMLLHALSPSV